MKTSSNAMLVHRCEKAADKYCPSLRTETFVPDTVVAYNLSDFPIYTQKEKYPRNMLNTHPTYTQKVKYPRICVEHFPIYTHKEKYLRNFVE